MRKELRRGLKAFYKDNSSNIREIEIILDTTMYLMEKLLNVGMVSQVGYYQAKIDTCLFKLYGSSSRHRGFKVYAFKEKRARGEK